MEHTPIKKRKQQAIETKERIYNATISLIRERGFSNVLMEDITKAAGVSAGLFYNYFANKADVITEAFCYRSCKYYDAMEQELQDIEGIAKLRMIIKHMATLRQEIYDKEELRYHHVNILETHKRLEDVRENSSKLHKMIMESLTEAKAAGEIPAAMDIDNMCNVVMLVLRGATWEYLAATGKYPFEERTWDIISGYIKGI